MKLGYVTPLLAILLAFAGCKNNDDFEAPDRGRSFLHIVSGAETTGDFDLTFNYWNASSLVISDFYYGRNWPLSGYADLEEGGIPDALGYGKIWLTSAQGSTPDTILGPKDILLSRDEKSSICFVDSSGFLTMFKVEDAFNQPQDTFALVRIINLKQETPNVSFVSRNGLINIPSTNFMNVSNFMTFPSGVYDFDVIDNGTSQVVDSLKSFMVGEGNVYSFFVSGSGNGKLDHYRN